MQKVFEKRLEEEKKIEEEKQKSIEHKQKIQQKRKEVSKIFSKYISFVGNS